MSLGACLLDLRTRGLISEARAKELQPVYDELVLQYEGRYGRAAAESMATKKALDMASLDAMHKKRAVLLQAKAQGQWLGAMRKASGNEALSRRVAEDMVVDMDNHRRAIRNQALQMNTAMLEKHRQGLRGKIRKPEEMLDTMAELFGRDTGNLNAKEIADSWRQTGEYLRSRFNAAGGRIAKLDSWALPQRHDMRSVRDAGFDTWRNTITPLLDRAKMLDRQTGEPMTDGRLELVLRDMWQSIGSDGWTDNKPGTIHAGALSNKRTDHRVLHFAGPEEWQAYAEQFGGGGTAHDAMISHIEAMSRDIAAMERMGPNPNATLTFQQDWLRKSAKDRMTPGRAGDKENDAAETGANQLERLYNEFTGANNRPENRRLALGFSVLRSVQVAAKLGGALLSVGGDFGTLKHTAKYNGLPAAKMMGRYVSMLNPANTADRAQAARTVLMSDQWADGHAAQWRATGEEMAHEGARRLATGVLRMSGLVAHTDIARQAFGMEMVSHLTHQRNKDFGNLDPAFRKMLNRYGIGETRWQQLRSMQADSYKETDWLYPETVAKLDQKLADDYMRMIVTEADFAVPVPDLRTRALIGGMAKKGTWGGEVVRSAFLFKGFPLTIMSMHGRRMLDEAGGKRAVANMLVWRYGVQLMAMTTLGGALSIQLKEIANGRDPRDMTTAAFWGAAALQGGGLGIFGDMIKSTEQRFGGGIAATLMGPLAQTVDNVGSLTFGNAIRAAKGEETTVGKDLAKIAMSETPGISLWYTRLMTDRLVGDLFHEWTFGEDVGDKYRRLEKYAEEQGTGYWAPPGAAYNSDIETSAPNFENMAGTDAQN